MKKVIRIIKIAIFLGVLAAFGFLVSRKIDLITADLGRHIINGYTILHGSNTERQEVLYSNYYSYTEPQRVFVNHHWGSGVLFYWVHQLAGFVGVSVFFVALCLLTFALYYAWAIQKGGWLVATALAILLMPLMASRAEVRPEVFTYLFSGIYLIVLNHAEFNAEKRGIRKLWLLPAVMLVWVNLHIGFIFGFFILGIFGLVRLGQDLRLRIIDKSKPVFSREFITLFKIGLVCLVAALVNPWFIKGVLYPFQIFRNYGYMIVENQSVRFLEKLGVTSTLNFGLYKIALGVAGVSMVVASVLWLRRRKAAGVGSIAENAIVVVFGVLGYLGIRHFPSFAFLALPVVAGNLAVFRDARRASSPSEKMPFSPFSWREAIVFPLAVFCIVVGLFRIYNQISLFKPVMGFGLLPAAEEAGKFYKSHNIQGPLFNNYDIGGYAIFYLRNNPKVFVDNRPEAYSVDFFEKTYKPMQTDNAVWKEVDKTYNFNSILFSHRDYTPWGQQFLVNRIQDPDWAVVYFDQYAIVMLKRNAINATLIKEFEIPKNLFGVQP